MTWQLTLFSKVIVCVCMCECVWISVSTQTKGYYGSSTVLGLNFLFWAAPYKYSWHNSKTIENFLCMSGFAAWLCYSLPCIDTVVMMTQQLALMCEPVDCIRHQLTVHVVVYNSTYCSTLTEILLLCMCMDQLKSYQAFKRHLLLLHCSFYGNQPWSTTSFLSSNGHVIILRSCTVL